jgi:hypothetical protein
LLKNLYITKILIVEVILKCFVGFHDCLELTSVESSTGQFVFAGQIQIDEGIVFILNLADVVLCGEDLLISIKQRRYLILESISIASSSKDI